MTVSQTDDGRFIDVVAQKLMLKLADFTCCCRQYKNAGFLIYFSTVFHARVTIDDN